MAEKPDYTRDKGDAGAPGAAGEQGPAGEQGQEGPPGTTTWAGITDKPDTIVEATAVIADNHLVRGDGDVRNIQESSVIVDDQGIMTNPGQPIFSAYVNNTQANVTGDETVYVFTGNFWTKHFDQGDNFCEGVFTAPINGKYLFTGKICLSSVEATHSLGFVEINVSEYWKTIWWGNMANLRDGMTDKMIIGFAALYMLDKYDTANLLISVYGGNKSIDVEGWGQNVFSGHLVG